ncbi:hypothetical protein [Bacillus sp. FDAARGOS_235]|uniref:hypothetical protein n=1 Tax=Bacillus sp. FDAARGOS_235 TaxID=1839798 RepID=UPI0011A8BF59|nr:hypothetical protein [Bacillus sp. FDAARGOS_235]
MKNKQIRDNYSLKNLEFELERIRELNELSLYLFYPELVRTEQLVRFLQEIPDSFNSYYSEQGWIAFDSMDKEISSK